MDYEQYYNLINQQQNKPLGFGKTMLAAALGMIIGSAVLSILSFIFFVVMMMSMASSFNTNEAKKLVGDDYILRLDLSKAVVERAESDNLFATFAAFGNEGQVGMDQLLKAIDAAKSEKRINGIYLDFGEGSSIDWAQSEELRDAILDYRSATGKPVYAFASAYTQPAYLLATAADRVMLHPDGMLLFTGIGGEVMFYKDLLDKLEVKVDLIRPNSNSFKSAGETYTRNNMSEANREQIRSYLGSVWSYVLNVVSESRQIPVADLNRIADNLEGVMANGALQSGLVDTLCFSEDVREMLKEQLDGDRFISAANYCKSLPKAKDDNKIAVIYAEGSVVSGSSDGFQTQVYGDDVAKAFREAAEDDDVKAIVLRVNSPGGAVTASEQMTHAIMKAKEKKPIIVSMSGVAASAGYEISCNANVIVAQPSTITGSIGVFGMHTEVGTMLRKKLGITTDTVATNHNSCALGVMRPLSPVAREMMQKNVEDFYVTFCSRVAKGRNMSVSAVDSIARGRVWTGLQAKEIGLVDTLGGMSLALRIAAEKAGISNYSTVAYPKNKSSKEIFSEMFGEKNDDKILLKNAHSLAPVKSLVEEMTYWATQEPLQARMEYMIEF